MIFRVRSPVKPAVSDGMGRGTPVMSHGPSFTLLHTHKTWYNKIMIALIEKHRDQIAALCRQYGVRRLELFGSAARGDFNANSSDVDFFLRVKPD